MNALLRHLSTFGKKAGVVPLVISGLVLHPSAATRAKWNRLAVALTWVILAAILPLGGRSAPEAAQGPVPPRFAAVLPSGFFRNPGTARDHHPDPNRVLFVQNCTLCHTGELVLRRTKGWSRDRIRSALDHLNRLNPAMPDYKGTAREKDRLADFIFRMNDRSNPNNEKPLPE